MSLLKNQIILHPDFVGQFSIDKPVTPYEHRVGFSWYLCPATVATQQVWLLVNIEFGYCELLDAPENTSADIEQCLLDVIERHLPDDREEDNVSVSLNPADVSWHTADKIPVHVGIRYQQATDVLHKCKDICDAEDALETFNDTEITIGSRTFAPADGLNGLLEELADRFRQYIETTPWWKLQWHLLIGKRPWLNEYGGSRRRPVTP